MSARTWKASPSKRKPEWLVVIGPYWGPFIEDLKRSIPAEFREWDAIGQAWRVHVDQRHQLETVIAAHSEAS